MRVTSPNFQTNAVLLLGLAIFCGAAAATEPVYKCVKGGKVTFTSAPSDNCQALDLKVVEPNPVDVARQQDENRRYAAEQAKRREEDKKREAEKQKEIATAKKDAEAQRRALLKSLGNTSRSENRNWRKDADVPSPDGTRY